MKITLLSSPLRYHHPLGLPRKSAYAGSKRSPQTALETDNLSVEVWLKAMASFYKEG
jgi:hypothetical protein